MATVEEYHGNKIDWKSLYEKSLNHDFAEVFTGDIKTPVKYASKELKHLFSQVEEEMVDTFIKERYQHNISTCIVNVYKKVKMIL